MKLIHRKNGDYIGATHREYFGQFVDENVMATVLNRIGLDKILNSTDKHMNDIPLKQWDMLHPWMLYYNQTAMEYLDKFNQGYSLSDTVCVAKEAARQIQENNSNIDES